MSLERRGKKWRVRWTEGGHHRSREFDRKGDAETWEGEVRRRKQLGPLASQVLVSQQTLTEFVLEEWWPKYAIVNLKPNTRRRYAEVWATHLNPRLGGYRLGEITPALVEDLAAQLHGTNLSVASQRKVLLLLQGILRRAVVRGLIASNPVQAIDKPHTPTRAWPEPLAPETVEKIRSQLKQRDAVLVSLMAYAGLRPGEAITAPWHELGERKLHLFASKTQRERRVDLLAPLAQDLAEWRLASGRPDGKSLIVPTVSGGEWTREIWANWRRRIYQPAAKKAGVKDLRPYALRGSFASLLLWEGRSLPFVAAQDGHSVATLAKHYAGVLDALEHAPRVSAEEAIRQARETVKHERLRSVG